MQKQFTLFNALVLVTVIKSIFDIFGWFQGASHLSLLFSLSALFSVIWYFFGAHKAQAVTLLVVLSIYRAALNLSLIAHSIPLALDTNRLLFINVIVFLLPAVISIILVADWKTMKFGSDKNFLDILKDKTFLSAIVIIPFVLPLLFDHFLDHFDLWTSGVGAISWLVSACLILTIIMRRLSILALALPLIAMLNGVIRFYDEIGFAEASFYWPIYDAIEFVYLNAN